MRNVNVDILNNQLDEYQRRIKRAANTNDGELFAIKMIIVLYHIVLLSRDRSFRHGSKSAAEYYYAFTVIKV